MTLSFNPKPRFEWADLMRSVLCSAAERIFRVFRSSTLLLLRLILGDRVALPGHIAKVEGGVFGDHFPNGHGARLAQSVAIVRRGRVSVAAVVHEVKDSLVLVARGR